MCIFIKMITTSNEILQECISFKRHNTAVTALRKSVRHFVTAAERPPDSSPDALLFPVWRLIRCGTPRFISVVPSGSLSSMMLLRCANKTWQQHLLDQFTTYRRFLARSSVELWVFCLLNAMLSACTTIHTPEPTISVMCDVSKWNYVYN